MRERENKTLAAIAAVFVPPIVVSAAWIFLGSFHRSGFYADENVTLFVVIFFFPTAVIGSCVLGTLAYSVLY